MIIPNRDYRELAGRRIANRPIGDHGLPKGSPGPILLDYKKNILKPLTETGMSRACQGSPGRKCVVGYWAIGWQGTLPLATGETVAGKPLSV